MANMGAILDIRKGMISAILNLHVALMPPTKFRLNLIRVREQIWFQDFQDGHQWPSWIAEQNDFGNSESLCRANGNHQVSAQSDLRFGRRCPLKNFKMAAIGYQNGTILAILNLYAACCSDPSHQVSAQSDIWFDRRCRLKNFKMAAVSWISEWKDFSNSKSLCHCDASHQFLAQSTYSLGGDVI